MLAAQSVVTHNADFKKYYLRKFAEGKAKKTALNDADKNYLHHDKYQFAAYKYLSFCKPYVLNFRLT